MTTQQSQDSSPSLLERFGIYRVESLLGQGGMGEVYLAWDELLQRRVAIKRVRTDRLGDETQRIRFLREARAVARLDHPAIVRIYHILERDQSHCLVMEYVEGQDLATILAEGLVSLAQAAAIGRDIAAGLAAAHDQGLIHRDLKPANVMVVAGDKAEGAASELSRAKILDFGLAKSFGGVDTDEDELTRSDMIVGTAHAMSPEQASSGPVDHRSDLFALGSLLYELLSGQAPFRGAHVMDSLRRVLTVEPEPIARLLPRIPQDFAALVRELLSKDPASRPASAHGVAERLAAIVASLHEMGGEVLADPDSPTAEFVTYQRSSPRRASPRVEARGLAESAPEERVLRTVVHAAGAADPGAKEGVAGLAKALMMRFNAWQVAEAEGVFLFQRPAEAVAFALVLHRAVANEGLELGLGLHLGEVNIGEAQEAAEGGILAASGDALVVAADLARRARGRQTLLGRGVFDLVRGAHSPEELTAPQIRWLAHGTYLLEGHESPLEIFEVGMEGFAPLEEPPDSGRTRRAPSVTGIAQALGWRPAAGQAVPRRANWTLEERLGEGGFGEVWLARHPSGDERVFKFCFEADRLRSLRREVALFRLMRETLGHRRDIARLLDWDFDEAPYFLESEYGDDLVRWADRQGGLAAVPLATRLELVRGIAEALAAAHSVGVLHKDVKPSNVLINRDVDGRPYARLADFGIGRLIEVDQTPPGLTVAAETSDQEGGTVRYMAPELLAGEPATVQADVYALGVTLYQLVIGDFERPIASGWRREVEDELLAEDIAACVDGSPQLRLSGPAELAERLRSLESRRAEREAEAQAHEAAQRAAWRRQLASSLSIAAAVMAVVVSIFAFQAVQAKNRELEARQKAEQRRHQAETLIDFMLGDLRSELEPLGKLDILDKVGDQAMEYFAAVSEGELSDDETASYAKALDQIGQVRFALGEMDEAATVFRRSLAMTQELAARNPADPEVHFRLGQSHFWVGYAHWNGSQVEAALEQFEAYQEISKRLVERDPENFSWQRELAYSYSNLGSIFEEQGRLPEATRALEANARILEGLSLERPEDRSLTDSLASAYAKLGRVAETGGELTQARLRHEASLAIIERAAAKHPGDMELAASMNNALFQVGKVLQLQGDVASALERFRQALEISRRMVAHEPGNRTWQRALAADLGQTSRLLVASGDLSRASLLAVEGGQIVEAILRESPDHRPTRSLAAQIQWTQACVELRRGRWQRSQESFRDLVSDLEGLVEERDSLHNRLWLVKTLEKLGESYALGGDPGQAATTWRKGLELARELTAAESSPEHLALLTTLLILTQNEGEARPFIERLAAMGYRRPSYRDLLDRSGFD